MQHSQLDAVVVSYAPRSDGFVLNYGKIHGMKIHHL